MPILRVERKLLEVDLVAIEGGKVWVQEEMLAADIDKMAQQDNAQSVVKALAMLIKEWNLTDEEGETLPIDEKTVGALSFKDVNAILLKLGLIQADLEKKA